jgi:hypothetical protein
VISAEVIRQIIAEMRLPALSMYGGDWLRDPVSGCSIAAQGLWFRLLLAMHDAKPYGHLVGNNGKALGESAVARSCGVSPDQLRRLRAELEEVGVPGRTGDRDYDFIFKGEINGEEIDLSPLRIDTQNVIYSRRLIKDQRLRVIRRLALIYGRPKSGRLTGQTDGQNAERDARGRAANDNENESTSPKNDTGDSRARDLTPQQQAVKDIEDALQEHTHGFAIPDPARVAKEIKTYGVDHIVAAIAAEGPRGQLDGRNWSYLHQILESRKRRPYVITGGSTGSNRRAETGGGAGGTDAPPIVVREYKPRDGSGNGNGAA